MHIRRIMTVWAVVFGAVAGAAETTLDWSMPVTQNDRHNAFTDLIRWNGLYYLTFRHGAHHNSGDGVIRILRSDDMKTWEPCGELTTLGDDRDPHFAATDDTLFVYFGTWDLIHSDGPERVDRKSVKSFVASTEDGTAWSRIQGIYVPEWWVWRVRQHEGRFYGIAYTAYRPRPDERETRLLVSDDGKTFELVNTIATENAPSESDLLFEADGSITVVTRMEGEDKNAYIYRGDPAHTTWTAQSLGHIIQGPAVVRWNDRVFAAGRTRGDDGMNTSFFEIVDDKAVHLLTLPSGGDTSYPGLVADPDSLDGDTPGIFISWYSQHDAKAQGQDRGADVYVGRITIRD